MEKLFYPDSIVIFGLSAKPNNIPKTILENLLRWGYNGRIFGVNPGAETDNVDGIKMFLNVDQLPVVPDLGVILIPSRYVPATVESCGRFGIKRLAILTGGFNETSEEGRKRADKMIHFAKEYGIRFIGPNGLGVANTDNGLCLPFVPSFSPPKGGFSLITQSGGLGIMSWNLMSNEDFGMAKFASIGNKLDLDEVDFLEYFGRDPQTTVIGLYLETITRGKELIETAAAIDKPVLILKSNTTEAGKHAAMSHTASLSNDDHIIDTAFERAGIIRVYSLAEFISVAKAFELPPMKGQRIMILSPAGGMGVMMADICEKIGFEFADPGREFYNSLDDFSNAGIINFTNPLDMGDIVDPKMHAHIFYSVLHNQNVDGAIYATQRPHMPREDDVFYHYFHTDISKETIGAIHSSGKPLGVCLYGPTNTTTKIKRNLRVPVYDDPGDMIKSLKAQADYHAIKSMDPFMTYVPDNINIEKAINWVDSRKGTVGEESLELASFFGINTSPSQLAVTEDEAVNAANELGYPVVMKVVSPDAVHKSDAGGVIIGIDGDDEAKSCFTQIRDNLQAYRGGALFEGVRVAKMAGEGLDMFIGAVRDPSFGPVVFFGLGGIYIEAFEDTENVLCPSNYNEIEKKLKTLKSHKILSGLRGQKAKDINAFIKAVERVTHLMAKCPRIEELDLNPVRVFSKGSGILALDGRLLISD